MDTIEAAETQRGPFSFLEQSQTTPLTTSQVVYDISGTATSYESPFSCDACCKKFTTKASLKRHHERFPVCVDWITNHSTTVEPNKQIIPLDVLVDSFVSKSYFDEPFVCRYCKESFSNRGNCNRHFTTSVACSRLAIEHFHSLWMNK